MLRPRLARSRPRLPLHRRHNSTWTTIDMHSHFLPKSWPCLATRHGGEGWPSMRHAGPLPAGTFGYDRTCSAMLMSGDADFRPVTNACWDVRARLDDLDRFGVHSQVISATPILFQWDRPREASLDVARHFNDAALEMCSASHGRLHALCQVPLNHVDDACLELERSMENGHVGVHIGNHAGTKDLDDEGIVTFLQHAAALDAAVLVHPWDMDPLSGRLARHMMGWTVGMPLETHLSIVSMVRCPAPQPVSPPPPHHTLDTPPDTGRGFRSAARKPAHLLCPRRRRLPLPTRPTGERLAPTLDRPRLLDAPALALPRPFLRRLGCL